MAVQTTVWGVECVGCGRKWDVGQVMQAVVDLTASQERVRELEMRDEAWESTMREIANSGVEFEDERVGYVTVQIDRDIWLSLAALRGPSTVGATGEHFRQCEPDDAMRLTRQALLHAGHHHLHRARARASSTRRLGPHEGHVQEV